MYFIFLSIQIGFFISLSFYVDAFSVNFKAIINEMNDGIHFEGKQKIDSSARIAGAISHHNEMFKYVLESSVICVVHVHLTYPQIHGKYS